MARLLHNTSFLQVLLPLLQTKPGNFFFRFLVGSLIEEGQKPSHIYCLRKIPMSHVHMSYVQCTVLLGPMTLVSHVQCTVLLGPMTLVCHVPCPVYCVIRINDSGVPCPNIRILMSQCQPYPSHVLSHPDIKIGMLLIMKLKGGVWVCKWWL